jgi:Ni,Fe-hydrogenase III small subunit
MSILKNKKIQKFVERLPNPKIFVLLGIAIVLGVIIYVIVLLCSAK